MSDFEKDLVLALNQHCYILDCTKGQISCWVGPCKTTTSQSDSLVVFDEVTKNFKKVNTFSEAIKLNVTAPENWYVVLKNPTANGKYPQKGCANVSPDDIMIGKKVNIVGPVSFALYPGQMAKVIQGHRLRSNQYLLARVYEPDLLNKQKIATTDEKTKDNNYVAGQLLIIKGTEQPFYIPPTGIEVIPIGGDGDKYVRDAVSLERLEYCILRDEEGNKRYVHGPAVVFPEATEAFVEAPTGGYKFKAIELSDISGIYVKVIANYTDDDGEDHYTGEELFITGKEQRIYYPRPEHVIIKYGEKEVHHAIAIPKGEGRYVMNRMTGEIRMEKGPSMFLPDPRFEVIVKRTLTRKQCELWYPGNKEVLEHNGYETSSNNDFVYKNFSSDLTKNIDAVCYNCCEFSPTSTLTRGTAYTKPRTITIDNKYDGVVTIDVWTGFAINVIGKDGSRKVVTGPNTYLMAYDESLEVLELSTGKPKTTDKLHKDVFLRVENNKISDIINVETKDFVNVEIKVSYCVDFLPEFKDKWFSVENYVKFMCDKMRSLMKNVAKEYTVADFKVNYAQITREAILKKDSKDNKPGRLFNENGMFINDVEVLSINIADPEIAKIIKKEEQDRIKTAFSVETRRQRVNNEKEIFLLEKEFKDAQRKADTENAERDAAFKLKEQKLKFDIEIERQKIESAKLEYDQSIQEIRDIIQKAELERLAANHNLQYKKDLDENNLDKQKKDNYAAMVERIMKSISPDFIAAMQNSSNAEMISAITENMSPWALAKNESAAEVTSRLLRGTVLEDVFEKMVVPKED